MTDKQQFNREVRRAAVMTVALACALLFGIIVLAGGDWIPGGIIVAAALVGLARQVQLIRTLCTGPTKGDGDDDHHFFRASGRGA